MLDQGNVVFFTFLLLYYSEVIMYIHIEQNIKQNDQLVRVFSKHLNFGSTYSNHFIFQYHSLLNPKFILLSLQIGQKCQLFLHDYQQSLYYCDIDGYECVQCNNNYNFRMDWVNPLAKVNNKFKFQLFGKTYDNLIPLYTQIPKFDPSNQGSLSDHAFNLLLNAGGLFLTTQEIRTVKDAFPGPNGIAYRQFIDNVRNDITPKRLATIDHTFQQFRNNGNVSIATLLSNLRADKHPHVRSLTKKAEKAQRDIEDGLRYWSADGNSLTYEEFVELAKDANACIPLQREQFFVDLFIHSFGLFQNGVSNERILQLQVTVFQRVRQRTEIKKDEGIRSNSAFHFIDLEEKGLIDYQRFVAVLDRIGCRFTDKQCKALFYKHSNGSTLLSYENLCGLLFQMGSGVKDNTNPVFQLAKSGQGCITTHGMTKRLN